MFKRFITGCVILNIALNIPSANSLEEALTDEDDETQNIQQENLPDLSGVTKHIPDEETESKGLFDILFGPSGNDPNEQEATKPSEYIHKESVMEENYSTGTFLNTAVLKVIDRTIGKLYHIPLSTGSSKQIGNITIKVTSCWNPMEKTIIPQSRALLEVYEAAENSQSAKNKIFHGWIIASHPAASFISHPIYDISLAGCVDAQKTKVKKEVKEKVTAAPPADEQDS